MISNTPASWKIGANRAGGAPSVFSKSPYVHRPERHIQAGYSSREQAWGPTDRLLRYPDGAERLIRYPSTAQLRDSGPSVPPEIISSEEFWGEGLEWHICGVNDIGCFLAAEYDSELPGAAPVGELWGDETRSRAAAAHSLAETDGLVGDSLAAAASSGQVLDSPAALFAYHHSEAARQERATADALLQSGFEVHWSCPWVQPRQVVVLMQPPNQIFTLPTMRSEGGGMAELANVLGTPGLADVLSHGTLHDGVLCFGHDADAAAFADDMHSELGHSGLQLVAVDSHGLFRMVADASGAVVVLKQVDGCLPRPSQLAAALRGKRSWDELVE